MNEAYENLANGIVLQAVADYRDSLRKLKRNPNYGAAIVMKSEVEVFFRSEWFKVLTSVDGEALMRRLQEEAETG